MLDLIQVVNLIFNGGFIMKRIIAFSLLLAAASAQSASAFPGVSPIAKSIAKEVAYCMRHPFTKDNFFGGYRTLEPIMDVVNLYAIKNLFEPLKTAGTNTPNNGNAVDFFNESNVTDFIKMLNRFLFLN
jgi:hypothetical protein